MTSTAQTTITLTPPPNPLPPTWARATANSIAEQLRHGWRSHAVKTTLHPTGAPRSPTYNGGATFPPQLPSTYLEHRELYAHGLVEPIDELGVPWIAWHLTQLDLAHALNETGLMRHAIDVDTWLKTQRRGRPADLYLLKPNRHGKPTLRRNADHAPTTVTDAFLAAVQAATLWLPDPRDVDDSLADASPVPNIDEVRRALNA